MRNQHPEDISVKEIHYLILEKRRASRNYRLEHFRRTGQVLPDVSDPKIGEASGNESPSEPRKVRNRKGLHRTWLDGLLLGMEILAVVGLIAVMVNGLSMVGTLNRSVAAALQQPTLEPTPIIKDVVLPEGHTPPNSPGG